MKKLSALMQEKRTLSFELFSPKTEDEMNGLGNTLQHLQDLQPDYYSCTYGAGGSSAERNLDTLRKIEEICPSAERVSHLTCIGHTEASMYAQLQQYADHGIHHILALRGDFPQGQKETGGDFTYALDLVQFIRREFGDLFEIGVTGMPEGHIESASTEQDIAILVKKQEAGADFVVTQLTFDMDQFAHWLEEVRAAGVTLPIDVGVMPVLSRQGVLTQCLSRNGCAIPAALARLLSRHWFDTKEDGSPIPEVRAAFREEGIVYSIQQVKQYQEMDIQGIHLYAMNRWSAVTEILTGASC